MWINYLNDVLKHRASELPAGRVQEMRTLSAALAAGAKGKHKTFLDILARRFIALEARATGQAALEPGMELIEATGEGLAGESQLRLASHELNRAARLQATIDKVCRGR